MQFGTHPGLLGPSEQQGEFQSTGGENIVLIGVSSVYTSKSCILQLPSFGYSIDYN